MAGGICNRENAWQGDTCTWGMCGGGLAWHAHPHWMLRDMISQCVGGTHPTRMHSC